MTKSSRNALPEDRHEETPSASVSPRHPDPSFLLQPANDAPREFLIERYRRTVGLAGDPLPIYGSASGEPRDWHHPVAVRRSGRPAFVEGAERLRNGRKPKTGRVSSPGLGKLYVVAGLAAMASGSAVGYGASQFDLIKAHASAIFAAVMPSADSGSLAPVARLQTAAATVIAKKSVATATLHVSDVAGQMNSFIPLALRAEPAAKQDLLLKISGLPDKAYLTAGQRGSDKVWALTLDDIKDVKLVVPSGAMPEINVAVAAFERNTGELAAPVKTMTIALADATVVPASAPPPNLVPQSSRKVSATQLSPIPTPVSTGVASAARQPSAEAVITGETLLASGDADGARQHFAKAWASGSADGALGLARSYDPLVHAELSIRKSAPDRRKALEWYERAADAGQSQAIAAIVRLKVKP